MRVVQAHILEPDDVVVGQEDTAEGDGGLCFVELVHPSGAASLRPKIAWFKSRERAEEAAENLRRWLRETGCMR